MVELPSEIMYDILSRMPVKSLGRFQCVSKLWYDYINDSYLEIMHAKRGVKDPAMLIMFQKRPSEYPNNPCRLNLLESKEEETETTTLYKIIEKNPPIMKFRICTKQFDDNLEQDIILGSCKGLLFSSQFHTGGTVLVVVHPLRKQSYELPLIRQIWSFKSKGSCGLGFDDSTNTFKMVCVVFRKHLFPRDLDSADEDLCTMVHVLGSDQDSWREIPQVPLYPIKGEGVYVDGYLYWLVCDGHNYLTMNNGRKIVCFDVRKEEFGLTRSPGKSQIFVDEQLVDLDGRLGFVYIHNYNLREVWLLKGIKWVLHCRFDKKPPLHVWRGLKVVGFWNKEGDLLVSELRQMKMFVYDLKNGVVREAFVHREYGCKADVRLYQSSWLSIHNSNKRCSLRLITH